MNVFEVAQQVNNRLYNGDENKFPAKLFVVGELLYALKPINDFKVFLEVILEGFDVIDNFITDIVDIFNTECNESDYISKILDIQLILSLELSFFAELIQKRS